LKIEKSLYFRNRLAHFDEILQDDVSVLRRLPAVQKSRFKNPRWRMIAILTNVKCDISAAV